MRGVIVLAATGLIGLSMASVGAHTVPCSPSTSSQPAPASPPPTPQQQFQQQVEKLKETNPEAYEQFNDQYQRQMAITATLKAFSSKEIDAQTARTKLYPLIQAMVEEKLANIDQLIAQAKQHLAQLQQMKQDRLHRAVHKQINEMLGLETARPGP